MICYNENNHTFTLNTENTTYQMQVDQYGFLLHLYYGRKTEGCMDFLLTYLDRGFSGNPYEADRNRTYSLDALPQEFPTYGTGDYRSPAMRVKNEDGSYEIDLRFEGYEILDGKYSLQGLPAVYADEEEAQTLVIHMRDYGYGTRVDLLYGVLPALDIITRAVKVVNEGSQTVRLLKLQSACLDFVTGDYDLLMFHGRHCQERVMQRTAIKHGQTRIGSRRGVSSHHYNPFVIVAGKNTSEDLGTCYSMSFVYSGGFLAEAEMDQFRQTRVQMGLMDELFEYPLATGEEFIAPEVIMTCSTEGFSKLSRNLHKCIGNHVCRGKYKYSPRPVLLNSWEACYFDFTGEDIINLAKEASGLNLDLLVLDDGWFGKRDDDYSGLGDWFVNEEKLGMSLGNMVKQVNDLGLKFGIWFEPECISEDSDLYREHPDWAFQIPGRNPVRARHQLVLDFSRKEVVDYIYEQMRKVLDQANIEYVKWDFNRNLYNVFSRGTKEQGKVMHDYVLGLYDILERLNKDYPEILIEGCSGGGGRFDAGMMYYTPQIWCSDNTDSMDRLRIQYGTSFGYPISTVGSHVSAVPNHQTGRISPLETRATVAMSGTFGYELNPAKMTEEEKEIVRNQIDRYHELQKLIFEGDYYRITTPEDLFVSWAFVSQDKTEAIACAVVQEYHANGAINYLRLKGLKSGTYYREEYTNKTYPSDALMEIGIPLPIEYGDYTSYEYHFVEVR
ncbi:MAG: alpha-galactosidase [Dorea sp.]|nr:alpha-galactosidase [Dorea sp.]